MSLAVASYNLLIIYFDTVFFYWIATPQMWKFCLLCYAVGAIVTGAIAFGVIAFDVIAFGDIAFW